MEMIVSMISSTAGRRADRVGIVRALVTPLKRLWEVYFTWRMETAILLLRWISDQEFSGIGLGRSGNPAAFECDIGAEVRPQYPEDTKVLDPRHTPYSQ
jgi:hypothetical protein